MGKSIIYKITNLVNGKIYIGQTSKSLNSRWDTHKAKYTNLKVKIILYNSMRKHGINKFVIEELERTSSDKVCERERYYIQLYDSFYKSGKGYNMTKGGENADTINNHPNIHIIKEKMSLSKLGSKNNRFGIKHTEETKLKMSDNHADFKKSNHPQAISFLITSPEGVDYKIKGTFKSFCKQHKLSHHVMRENINKGVINNITHKRSLRHNGWVINRI